LNYCIKIS